jgi:hypothetical protein
MSDNEKRNTEIMIAETQRQQKAVAELTRMVVDQNAKIATLTGEVAELKKAQIMASVQAQQALTGSGGTT